MKVVIASQNPVKINAVEQGFAKMFPNETFEFVSVSVPSDVSSQPFSDAETFLGAKNRVHNAVAKMSNADFYVGIEGGVQEQEKEIEAFAWVHIASNNKHGKSRTATFFLPEAVAELLRAGKELGEADEIVFKQHNSKQQTGAVGILTGDVVTRASYYTEAVVLVLIPFKKIDLY